jgi:hypothetical protein
LLHIKVYFQGWIQDFKIEGGGDALKKNALSGGRSDNFWGISCEKSRFYAKKIIFSLLDLPLPSIKETLLLDFLIYNNISVDS